MSKTVLAAITLAAIAASSLAAPVAAYKLTLTEAGGAVLSASAPVDATSISIPDVPAGTYTASIVAVDNTGNALMPAVAAADPLVITDPVVVVTVNVPSALAVSAS